MASRGIDMGLILVLVTMLWARAIAQSGCTNVLISLAPCLNYVTGSSSTPSSSCCSQLASVVQSQPQCLCTALSGGGASLGIAINQTLALSLPSACNVQTPPVSQCNATNEHATSPVGSPDGSPGDSSNGAPSSLTSPSVSAANEPATSPVGSPDGSPGDSSNGAPSSLTSPSISVADEPATSPVGSPDGSPEDSSNGAPSSLTSPSVLAADEPATSAVGSPDGSPGDSSNGAPSSLTSPSVLGGGSKTVPSTGGETSDGSTMKMPLELIGFLLFMASYASAFSSF